MKKRLAYQFPAPQDLESYWIGGLEECCQPQDRFRKVKRQLADTFLFTVILELDQEREDSKG